MYKMEYVVTGLKYGTPCSCVAIAPAKDLLCIILLSLTFWHAVTVSFLYSKVLLYIAFRCDKQADR